MTPESGCGTPFLDGRLPVYSTCRDCGELMQVTNPTVKVHPTCTDTPTKLETLLVGWVSCVLHGDYESAKLTDKEIELLTSKPPMLAKAAVRYTEWGWPVFPLKPAGCACINNFQDKCSTTCVCAKAPAIPKRKGGNGFKDATTDSERIGTWWKRHPTHNIGLATGHRFDVIDIDTKDSDGKPTSVGVQSFLTYMHKLPDVHGIAVTASGGMHLYVKATGKGNFAGVKPGIDYRGLGGYVVAPPSTLGKPGRDYAWLIKPSPIIKGDN